MITNHYKKGTVAIVGTGITSIMVAYELLALGYKVSIYTIGTDPRDNGDVEQYGATGNGRMGRFVTGFEGEPYLLDTPMYPKMSWAFSNPVSIGGWLAKPFSEFTKEDRSWLNKRINAAKNKTQIDDLYKSYYIKNNRESILMWYEFYKKNPILFRDTDISTPSKGILRLYDEKQLFDYTAKVHEKNGFLIEKLSPKLVAEKFPIYREAYDNGYIAGGLIVRGFSFNILKFVDNMISFLEEKGVSFNWNTEIQQIVINKNNLVTGLRTKKGELIQSENYSINPGAYGNDLLKGTKAEGMIGGVAGRWLVMPRPEGYEISTKIHGNKREGYPVTDNNLTPFNHNGEKMLAVGGGYVFVGSNRSDYAIQESYKIVDSENERTMKKYFGKFYLDAKKNNNVHIWDKTCIRSFTYNDVPIHEVIKTSAGGYLTITAGTNTGTTTLAPYLAKWTSNIISNS